MVKIIKCEKDFVVILKSAGTPSQKDPSGSLDAMTETANLLTALGECPDLWLVHRLDRNVGGLLVFARNKATAGALSLLVANGKIEKKYLAVAEGIPETGEYRDYIYKDASQSKTFIVERDRRGVKEARLLLTNIESRISENTLTLVDILLITGRFHQIRAQLSHRKTPLVGDKKYGSRDRISRSPALFCYSLSFVLKNREVHISITPDTSIYPWNIFEEKIREIGEKQ